MEEKRYSKEEVLDMIMRFGLGVPVDFVMEYWGKKNWKTKKGEPVKTLEAAVNVCNSIYCTRLRKELQESRALQRKQERLEAKYIDYHHQLQGEEWESYRNFILTVKGRECDICGSKSVLQIHHKQYINGRKAWEYLPSEVVVLCSECHKKIHSVK